MPAVSGKVTLPRGVIGCGKSADCKRMGWLLHQSQPTDGVTVLMPAPRGFSHQLLVSAERGARVSLGIIMNLQIMVGSVVILKISRLLIHEHGKSI